MNDETALPGRSANTTPDEPSSGSGRKPTAEEILAQPHGLLTRGHLAELGHGRRNVDAVFRELAVVVLPGARRPMVRACEYLELIERCTYDDSRVRS